MERYRLYIFDGPKLTGSEEIEAGSDDEALRLAREWVDTGKVEVWCGSRRVRVIERLTGR